MAFRGVFRNALTAFLESILHTQQTSSSPTIVLIFTSLPTYLDAVEFAAAGAAVEAANAETAIISCADMLVTIGFMSSLHGPRRAPVFMSNSCRMV